MVGSSPGCVPPRGKGRARAGRAAQSRRAFDGEAGSGPRAAVRLLLPATVTASGFQVARLSRGDVSGTIGYLNVSYGVGFNFGELPVFGGD